MKKKIFKSMSGLTFIEMIMTIGIFTMGIAGFTMLFARTWQNNAYTFEMGRDSMAASQGLNRIDDYIRRARQGDDGSYAVKSANDNDLVIFCDYDKDTITERLHFYKSGQNVMMGITRPTATLPKTYPTGDQSVVTLTAHVINDNTKPIFQYFNKDYPVNMVSNPITTPAPVADVRLVKVYLEVNIDLNHAPDNVHIQSFAEMRNLNDYNQAQ